MSVINDLSHKIDISSLYDFQHREFIQPYLGQNEVKLDQNISFDCSQIVFDDISCKLDVYGTNALLRTVSNIEITLSNKEPEAKYFKGVTSTDIFNQIGKYLNDDRLNKNDKHTLERIRRSILDGSILDGSIHDEERPSFEEFIDVSDMLKRYINEIKRNYLRRDHSHITVAEFIKPNKIIVYMKAVADEYDRNGRAEDYFAGTLAHELFHYYHFNHDFRYSKWDYKNPVCVPIESLASYYEYTCYVDERIQTLASKLEKEWFAHDMDVWPYAGAKYLYINRHNDLHGMNSLFKYVFDDSLINMKLAYEDLVVCRKHDEDYRFFILLP